MTVTRRVCLVLVAYHVLVGAGLAADAFYRSAGAAAAANFLSGPLSALAEAALAGGLLLVYGWLFLPLPLLMFGLFQVKLGLPGRWRWLAGWSAAVAAGVGLQASLIFGPSFDWLMYDPHFYPPPPGLSWVSLGEAVGFLVVGVAMVAILVAERSARRVPRARLADGLPQQAP